MNENIRQDIQEDEDDWKWEIYYISLCEMEEKC